MSKDKQSDADKCSLESWLNLEKEQQLEREPEVLREMFAQPAPSAEFLQSVMSSVVQEASSAAGEVTASWKEEFLFQALPLQALGAFMCLFLFIQTPVSNFSVDSSMASELSELDSIDVGSDELSGVLFGDSSLEEYLPEYLENESNV